MFDNDTELLVAIFQKMFETDDGEIKCMELDTATYIETYKTQIEAAGQMFAYLGLGKPDTQSPLGWRPTPLSLEIIAEKVARRPKPIDREVNDQDTLIIWLLCDAVYGEGAYQTFSAARLGLPVLHALGLLREDTDGIDLPTPKLRQLFAKAYYARRRRARRKGKLALEAPSDDAGQSAR